MIHIVPRRHESEVSGEIGFGPAMVELFGIFIVKHPDLWNKYTEDTSSLASLLIEIMRTRVSLS